LSLTYLLDTNIISEPLRPTPNPAVLTRLERRQDAIAIPSVVWHELLFGYYRLSESKKRTAIETYLRDVVAPTLPILSYDERAAAWHAAERARLTGSRRTPSFADGQIAAIAVVNDLRLVTENLSDFANFQDIQIENWIES
jgi:tRNA(fMet)-specific endonuclease VapC